MTLWIAAEVAQMRGFSGLQAIYDALGLVLLALGMTGGWRASPRLRWIIAVTLGEALGFLVPVVAGVATAASDLAEGAQGVIVVGAGLVEGPLLGAGLAWACAMGARAVGISDGIPVVAKVGVGLCAAAVALVGLGGAQGWVLCQHGVPARRWTGWTALA